MESKEAIKRLRQETCPCTYMPDFDKEECLKVIEKDLEILEILRKNLYIEKGSGRFKGIEIIECSLGSAHSGEAFKKVKEWLENE